MKIQSPIIAKQDFDRILTEFISLVPYYTPEWKLSEQSKNDPGFALARIFVHMLETIIQRLNQVPDKNFTAFLDTIGIKLLPARAATVPVTFFLAEGAAEHILIPNRTQVAAGELVFETEKNILATPSRLTALYGVNPQRDEVFEHFTKLEKNETFNLFTGKNLQEHILLLGHQDLFNIAAPADISLLFEEGFPASWNFSWQYFGENSAGEKEWHDLDNPEGNPLTLRKNEEGEIAEHEINGIKSRWIRCKVKPGKIVNVKDYQMDTVSVGVSPSSGTLLPDMAFYNDVPLNIKDISSDNPIFPFGKIPRINDSFYISSQEAFSKKGAAVTLNINAEINGGAVPDPCPMLSWEYWNGNGWAALGDIIENFAFEQSVNSRKIKIRIENFPVLRPIEINGQENFWIRIRLVDGHFGQEFKITGSDVSAGIVDPPRITSFTIAYKYPEEGKSLEHVLLANNLEFKDVTHECNVLHNKMNPFQPLENKYQSLYLGFDQKMEKGPISIFFAVDEQEADKNKMPKIKWNYSTRGNPWILLETIDNTRNLTSSGTIEFLMPPDFAKTAIFGKELYWIKAVDEKNNLPASLLIKGIYVNTVLAIQAESIKDEILGSSDGSANQVFKFINLPVIEQEIWVNETRLLTDDEKEKIIIEKGEDFISETKDETGVSTEIWVRWQPVEDFLGSPAVDRHYIVDGSVAEITFGSGLKGKIPPIGRDNIKAAYRTGGGQQGNVTAHEISTLKTSLPFIDGVTNYRQAEGGADTEQLAEAFERGPHVIKHRNRAVTEEDFERIAREASNYIARSKCIIKKNRLKIIVIPKEEQDKPMPSPGLIEIVEKHIRERCLNTILPEVIEVSTPFYKEVNVTVDLVPVSIDITIPLEREVLKKLKEFLHPLTGGPEKKGWQFGRDVHISDVYAMLESIEGVDHVEKLLLNNKNEDVAVADLETVCSGKHEITIKPGG